MIVGDVEWVLGEEDEVIDEMLFGCWEGVSIVENFGKVDF